MLFTPIVLVAALHTQPPAVQLPPQTSADTAEGLEILRRILVDSLEKTFQAERKAQRVTTEDGRTEGIVSLLVTGHQTVENSRVFHLPDAGVFFSLDAALPMVAKSTPPKDEPAGDAPRDDEWEKYRREVRGGGDPSLPGGAYVLRSTTAVEMEIDPTAVDKLIDASLQTLARHTGRIGGLGTQETITLAVKISGGYGGFSGHFWGANLLEDAYSFELQKEEEEPGQAGIAALPRLSTVFARSSASSQNLVLQIRVGDLAAYTNGGTAELRKRARINRY